MKTRAVRGSESTGFGPASTPIVHSATFSFPSLAALNTEQHKHAASAYYQRHGHPTLRACDGERTRIWSIMLKEYATELEGMSLVCRLKEAV